MNTKRNRRPEHPARRATATKSSWLTDALRVTFDATTGKLLGIRKHDGTEIPFNNGPVAVGMKMRYEPARSTLRETSEGAVYCARYSGGVDSIVWRLTDEGLLHMNALLLNRASGGQGFDDAFMDNEVYNLGLTFSYPETACTGMRWLGRGPYRVWKNRLAGARYGIWHKDYNDTVTGAEFETLVYPEFKGYHGNLYWATLENPTAPMTVYALSDGIFLRLFTPREPAEAKNGRCPNFRKAIFRSCWTFRLSSRSSPSSNRARTVNPETSASKKATKGCTWMWFSISDKTCFYDERPPDFKHRAAVSHIVRLSPVRRYDRSRDKKRPITQ